MYVRATSGDEAAAIRGIVPYNLAAALLLVLAAFVDGSAKWALFVVAGALLWAVPVLVSLEGFQISASHFVERHGLVVIVALGESIVVLGVGAGGAEVGLELALIAVLALALSASLWWTYFGREEPIEEAMASAPPEERPRLAIVFGYVHFFLLLGVVLVAAGLKKAIPDPRARCCWPSTATAGGSSGRSSGSRSSWESCGSSAADGGPDPRLSRAPRLSRRGTRSESRRRRARGSPARARHARARRARAALPQE
jgi:hypothetical protein